MATLSEYLKNLREQQKPQPQPVDEEAAQKAEAYDYLIDGEGETEDE